MAIEQTARQVIFVDGVCVMCNRIVHWLLRIDKRQVLSFATLQGETARQAFAEHPEIERLRSQTSTVIYVQGLGGSEPQIHLRSTAALMALWDIGGYWRVSGFLRLIPSPLRDIGYDWIARNRYRWFGETEEACLLPTVEDRSRFLD